MLQAGGTQDAFCGNTTGTARLRPHRTHERFSREGGNVFESGGGLAPSEENGPPVSGSRGGILPVSDAWNMVCFQQEPAMCQLTEGLPGAPASRDHVTYFKP